MTGDDVREIFEAVLPQAEIEALASELGVIERARKLDVNALVRAMVIAAGTPNGGLQADALRSYLEFGVQHVVRSAFYRWFDEPLEKLMERLAERALAYARAQQVDLPGPLSGVTDWRIVDSTTVKVRDAVLEEFPGTGDYAAIKVHKTLSVGTGAPVAYHFSRARDHDSLHLTIDEQWRGYGLLSDLGYASFDRIRACQTHDVSFVLRLKDNWKPRMDRINRGTVTREFFKGSDLDVLLETEAILLDGKAIDADVTLGPAADPIGLRLVGVSTPKGYCFFLTNLPKRIGPLQVGAIYRIRWDIELSNKLDKSVHRLDEGDAERPCSIKTLLHASLIASTLIALLVHRQTLATRPARPGTARNKPPLHPMLLARMLNVAAMDIARTFELKGKIAQQDWDRIAKVLVHSGSDPNWRRRPSVLDQMRGWKVQPIKRRKPSQKAKETA
jgi:hypothetical protein